MSELVDHEGRPVRLGPTPLAEGGEGRVFEVPGQPDRVAKLYKKPPRPEQADKLAQMVRLKKDELLKLMAWPDATLHRRRDRGVVGLLMPRIDGHREIHTLYSPRDRMKFFPGADWRYLTHVGLNCAIVFEVIHRGDRVVIGDVNQKNVLVAPADATVRLIDCDSFQLTIGGRLLDCGVGVPEYTPPELQGCDLRGRTRTVDHDRFGLAVLIFSLLMMGRHPFAGCYLGRGEMPLERAIRERRFAYSWQAKQYKMKRPPHAPSLEDLSPRLRELFELAFTTPPKRGEVRRPPAGSWHKALREFENDLCPCPAVKGHYLHKDAKDCPWCRLLQTTGIDFFGLAPTRPKRPMRSVTVPRPAVAGRPVRPVVGTAPSTTPVKIPWKQVRAGARLAAVAVAVLIAFLNVRNRDRRDPATVGSPSVPAPVNAAPVPDPVAGPIVPADPGDRPRWRGARAELDGPGGPASLVALSADGGRALIGGGPDLVVREVISGAEVHRTRLDGTVDRAALAPDGSSAFAAVAGSVYRIDLATGDLQAHGAGLAGPMEPGLLAVAAWSADGRYLLNGVAGVARRLDTRDGSWESLRLPEAEQIDLQLSADGGRALLLWEGLTEAVAARSWDVDGRRWNDWPIGAAGTRPVVSLSADGGSVLIGDGDRLRLVDADDGRTLRALSVPDGTVRSLAMAAGGRLAITGLDDGRALVWDVEDGAPLTWMEAHDGPVLSVAIAADGRSVLTGGRDGVARSWELDPRAAALVDVAAAAGAPEPEPEATAEPSRPPGPRIVGERRRFELGGRVRYLAFSADDRLLLAAGWGAGARVWDTATGAAVVGLDAGRTTIRGAGLAADGRRAFIGLGTGRLVTWDLERDARVDDEQVAAFTAAAFSRDGSNLLLGRGDGTVLLRAGGSDGELDGHDGAVVAAAFSGDGQTAITCGGDRANVWSVDRLVEAISRTRRSRFGSSSSVEARRAALREATLVRSLRHPARVVDAALSADGTRALTGAEDGLVRLWDGQASGKVIEGHIGAVGAVAISADGRLGVSSGRGDATLRVWDLTTGEAVRSFHGHVGPASSVALSATGRLAATGDDDGTVLLWGLPTASADPGAEVEDRTVGVAAAFDGHEGWVTAVAASEDGRRVFTGDFDGVGLLRDAGTGAVLARLDGHRGAIRAAAFSADGALLLTGGEDGTARLWDGATGAPIRTIEAHAGAVLAAALTADGALALTGGKDREVRLWETADGRVRGRYWQYEGEIRAVAFAPAFAAATADGLRVVAAGSDRAIRVWEALGPSEPRTLEGHANAVTGLAVSRDGRTLVSSGEDRTARVWDLDSGRELRRLEGHSAPLQAIDLSPDGRLAITAGDDGTVRLWDVAAGRLATTLIGHAVNGKSQVVQDVQLCRDGRLAVTGGRDLRALLWRLNGPLGAVGADAGAAPGSP